MLLSTFLLLILVFPLSLSADQELFQEVYMLPVGHPAKAALDALFANTHPTESRESLLQAGFEIVAEETGSFVTVARHPSLPGYLLKLYLDSETRLKEKRADQPHWVSLMNRCIGAEKIRQMIRKKGFKHFVVPDKWLYRIPMERAWQEPLLLIVMEMEIVDEKTTAKIWKGVASKRLLYELHSILKEGYGSTALVENVPYTTQGTFAFIDTEYPKKGRKLKRVKKYLPPKMQSYWDHLQKIEHQ